MPMGRIHTLDELARGIGAQLRGDGRMRIKGLATLENAGPGSLGFLANRKYRNFLAGTRATAVILAAEFAEQCPVAALVCEDPQLAYAKAARMLYPEPVVQGGIHPSADVHETASVDPSAWIGPLVVIEDGVRIGPCAFVGPGCIVGQGCEIGEDSRLVAHVTLCHGTRIGRRALIHPGAVLGGDGFSFARDQQCWLRIPQTGCVVLGDDVEVGANTTVDRGALDDTVIDDGVKLDNLIMIGHNVHIGKRTAVAACTGISGSCQIGSDCLLGGQVGMAGHLTVGDGVFVAAGANVTRNLEGPGNYGGVLPVDVEPRWRRNIARVRQLDELAKRIKQLERRLPASRHQGDTDPLVD